MMFHGKEEDSTRTQTNLMNVDPQNLIQPFVSPSIFLELTQVTLGQKAWTLPNLMTGIRYRNGDGKSISGQTLAGLIQGEFIDQLGPASVYQIIDCRHPFEFLEGHIMGAQNLHTREQIQKVFLMEKMDVEADMEMEMEVETDMEHQQHQHQQQHQKQPLFRRPCIYVFYCELSLEQAPKLLHFLRSKDNDQNYPELYLLKGGYKTFSRLHPQLCGREDDPMESPQSQGEAMI